MNAAQKNLVSKLVALAKDSNVKITHAGKTIWTAYGNPSGLHGYADTLLREKWEKSGTRFIKKVTGLIEAGEGELVVLGYRNVTRDRGKWVPLSRVDLATLKPKAVKQEPAKPLKDVEATKRFFGEK